MSSEPSSIAKELNSNGYFKNFREIDFLTRLPGKIFDTQALYELGVLDKMNSFNASPFYEFRVTPTYI